MTAQTPHEVERILYQLREVLTAWDEKGLLGEVAVLCGQNDYQVEERPKIRQHHVKRRLPRGKPLVKVGA